MNEEKNRGKPLKPHVPKLAYSIAEAIEATSLKKTSIYAHIAAGRLRAVRIAGRTIIPAESLHALIDGEN